MGKSGLLWREAPSKALDRQQPVKISSSQLGSFGKSLDWSVSHGDIRLHQAEYQHLPRIAETSDLKEVSYKD